MQYVEEAVADPGALLVDSPLRVVALNKGDLDPSDRTRLPARGEQSGE